MNILNSIIQFISAPFIKSVYADTPVPTGILVNPGFAIPSLTEVLSFAIKTFFIVAGLAALIFLILGSFAWVTSGGDKEAVKKAQDKIQSAVVGLIILVAVLAVMVTLEQVVFNKQICFGLTCAINIPTLLQPPK